MFSKILFYDIKNGFFKNITKYCFAFLFFFALGFICNLIIVNNRVTEPEIFAEMPTLGDYFLYAFGGIKEYQYDPRVPFMFPAQWIFALLFCLFLTLGYPENEQSDFGLQVVVRAESRLSWWISKIIWIIATVVVYYLVSIAALLVSARIFGAVPSFELSSYLPYILPISADALQNATSHTYLWAIFLLVPITSVTLSCMQLVLSLYIKTILSFLTMAAYLLFSAYFMTPVFLGNYAMVCRSSTLTETGMTLWVGILINIVLTLSLSILGWGKFERQNLL